MLPFKLPKKTPQVAVQLNATYWRIIGLIRGRKIKAPFKDDSGDFWWTPADIERAKKALAEIDRKRPRRAAGVSA
jgi:hypothetical protein